MQTMYDCACCGAPMLQSEITDRHQIREDNKVWGKEMLEMYRRAQAAEAEMNIMLSARLKAKQEYTDQMQELIHALEQIAFATRKQYPVEVREQRDAFNSIARTALQNISNSLKIEHVS